MFQYLNTVVVIIDLDVKADVITIHYAIEYNTSTRTLWFTVISTTPVRTSLIWVSYQGGPKVEM